MKNYRQRRDWLNCRFLLTTTYVVYVMRQKRKLPNTFSLNANGCLKLRMMVEQWSKINMQRLGIIQSLVWLKRRHWSRLKKEIATAIWGAIIYHTWRSRNSKQFKDANVNRETIVTQIKQEIKERLGQKKCSSDHRGSFLIQKFCN